MKCVLVSTTVAIATYFTALAMFFKYVKRDKK